MFKFQFDKPAQEESFEYTISDSLVQPSFYSIEKWKSRQPRISYTFNEELVFRDLFDIKYELMAKEQLSDEEKLLLEDTEDVKQHVYEGGLKVWEGTTDLLALVKAMPVPTNTMELGCGAGLPLCSLLYKSLVNAQPGKFVFADYNVSVLELLTVPNVILTWLATQNKLEQPHGEIILSSELVDEMVADLHARNIEIQFVSGCWSQKFEQLVGTDFDLVLASETIYSMEYLPNFTNLLLNSLKSGGKALVAAKKMYFGVGGGVVEFELMLDARKANYTTVLDVGQVGRVVLEVSK